MPLLGTCESASGHASCCVTSNLPSRSRRVVCTELGDVGFNRIGVGYDGSPESHAALAWARSVAVGCGADLCVRAVVDDRMPTVGWGDVWIGDIMRDWTAVVDEEKDSLRREAQATAERAGLYVDAEAVSGRPADALLELSAEVDLVVIG